MFFLKFCFYFFYYYNTMPPFYFFFLFFLFFFFSLPLFDLFYFKGPETHETSRAFILSYFILFFSLLRARDVWSPFFLHFLSFYYYLLYTQGLRHVSSPEFVFVFFSTFYYAIC